MSIQLFGALWLLLILIFIFLRQYVGVITALGGLIGLAFLIDPGVVFHIAGTEPLSCIGTNNMVPIPLFVLMGLVIGRSGLGEDLYVAASKWLGHIRGGLAMASTLACGVFAAVCSNSVICAMTMGTIAYPEMRRYNFKDSFSAAGIAAGGTIGILIPPSIGFIIYGLITENSIGKLFMAGIIPGLLQILLYMITCYTVCKFRPDFGPQAPSISFKDKIISLNKTWPIFLLIIFVIGGMYIGAITPNEAGGIGAVGAIILSYINRKSSFKEISQNIRESIVETAQTTAMVVLLMVGIHILMRFLTISQMPMVMTTFITELGLSKFAVLIVIVLLYIIAGAFMDVWTAILLTVPILYPVVMNLGFNPIWFGVLVVRIIEIGLVTPPFGMNVFVLSSTINVPVGTIYKGLTPFLLADLLHIALLITFPGIALMFE